MTRHQTALPANKERPPTIVVVTRVGTAWKRAVRAEGERRGVQVRLAHNCWAAEHILATNPDAVVALDSRAACTDLSPKRPGPLFSCVRPSAVLVYAAEHLDSARRRTVADAGCTLLEGDDPATVVTTALCLSAPRNETRFCGGASTRHAATTVSEPPRHP